MDAPDPAGPVEDVFPAVSVGTNGRVYMAAYRNNASGDEPESLRTPCDAAKPGFIPDR